ncbi:MAG TPA: dephospho-CoA kinase, partial [Acidobacteriota bacterium]|nr:dephospho-CoA kinase [Acidobacteriota bacterium]
ITKRDGISKEEAAAILKAQLPIEEKLGYADLVVNNEGSLVETKRQVEELWHTLKNLQEERIRSH